MSRSSHFASSRRRRARGRPFFACLLLAALPILNHAATAQAAAKETTENYPGGQVHLSYGLKDGKKEGSFTEFYESGKPKVKAAYKNDLLVGPYTTYFETGEPNVTSSYRLGKLQGKTTELDQAGKTVRVAAYDDGQLQGAEVLYREGAVYWQITWNHGQPTAINGSPIYPRSYDDVWHALNTIYADVVPATPKPIGPGRKLPPIRPSARDPLHPGATGAAAAVATSTDPALQRERIAALRRLNAYRYLCEVPEVLLDDGAPSSAASKMTDPDHGSIVASIDHFFDATADEQVASLEGRRWCLNPAMRTVGLGRTGDSISVWSNEDRRRAVGDWQTIAFPPRGYVPQAYFAPKRPWSLALNSRHLTTPGGDFEVSIRPLDEHFHPGEPLEIADKRVATKLDGQPDALVFKPTKIDVAAGSRYWVEITGVTNTAGKPNPIRYLVDFRDMRPELGMIGAVEGLPIFPRTLDQIRRGLEAVNNAVPVEPKDLPPALGKDEKNPTLPPGDPAADQDALAAVRRLNGYRFLSGVPADVALDPEETYYAQAGAKLLAAIKKLDHTPANPGLPEAEYKDGYTGTSHSNIFQGRGGFVKSIEGYMNDSDAANIDRIGHRRWCLNPAMQTTGFGAVAEFSAMWSFDQRRPEAPQWQMITYPARGYMPLEYFSPDQCWCVILNPQSLKPPTGKLDVSVHMLDEQFRAGPSLDIGDQNIETKNYGGGVALIFRPKNLKLPSGSRFGVEIKDVTDKDDNPLPIRYVVEFVDLARAGRSGR